MTPNDNIKPNQAPLFSFYPVPVTLEAKRYIAITVILKWFRREQLVERLRRIGGI
jgi:hypothetical protein